MRKKTTTAATPHKMGWAAIAASIVVHTAGFAALSAWSTSSKHSYVRFAGRAEAIQFTLSFADPQWSVDLDAYADLQPDPLVIIEPAEARIGMHSYVYAPTVEISPDDLLLESDIEPTRRPPELTLFDDVDEVLARPTKNRTTQPRQTNPKKPESAAVQTPSSSGNAEDIPPDLSHNTPPTYPFPAIQNGWEGTVLLRVWIDEAGHVTKVEVARTSGFRILDGAAATAVRRWNAVPAIQQGKPVASIELLPVRFEL